MAPATLKIKKKLLDKGDSIQALADRWGYSRHLVTKVIHGERGNTEVRKRLARYVGESVEQLFGIENQQRRAA